MQILLTNDDGVHAPGLRAMRDALARFGEVQVVAPLTEQSGVGLGITYLHPLMVHEEFREGEHFAWAVAGSPADCVKLGMLEFCRRRPDVVVSGINAGANAGINVLYSGTVAGAIEGAFFGVPSVAVSLADSPRPDWDRAAKLAARLIEQLAAHSGEPGALWNVNIPESRPDRPLGVKVVSMGVRRHVDVMEKRTDPRGRTYYWSGLDPVEHHELERGTDVAELAEGYVTVTPMHFDLTDADRVRALEGVAFDLADG